MNEPRWWNRRAIKIIGVVDVLAVVAIVAILMIPALAATIVPVPGTDYVVNLGDGPPWIMAIIGIVNTWILVAVYRKAGDVASKVDGLTDAKVALSVAKEKKAGEEKATTLAEGQRQGADLARSSVTSDPLTTTAGGRKVPVVDDIAGAAAQKSANALESMAETAKKEAAKEKP